MQSVKRVRPNCLQVCSIEPPRGRLNAASLNTNWSRSSLLGRMQQMPYSAIGILAALRWESSALFLSSLFFPKRK
jgi:hypothetical protein